MEMELLVAMLTIVLPTTLVLKPVLMPELVKVKN